MSSSNGNAESSNDNGNGFVLHHHPHATTLNYPFPVYNTNRIPSATATPAAASSDTNNISSREDSFHSTLVFPDSNNISTTPSSLNSEISERTLNSMHPSRVNHDDDHQHHHASPPVAVVVSSSDRAPSSTSYPVATFVQNLVRPSMCPQHSLRSEPGPVSLREALQEPHQQAASVRTMNDALLLERSTMMPPTTASAAGGPNQDEGNNEYLLIDGDLVIVPSSHSASQGPRNNIETVRSLANSDISNDERMSGGNNHPPAASDDNMRGGRVQRGMKKVSQFFQRVRRQGSDINEGSGTATTGSSTTTAASPNRFWRRPAQQDAAARPSPLEQDSTPSNNAASHSASTLSPLSSSQPPSIQHQLSMNSISATSLQPPSVQHPPSFVHQSSSTLQHSSLSSFPQHSLSQAPFQQSISAASFQQQQQSSHLSGASFQDPRSSSFQRNLMAAAVHPSFRRQEDRQSTWPSGFAGDQAASSYYDPVSREEELQQFPNLPPYAESVVATTSVRNSTASLAAAASLRGSTASVAAAAETPNLMGEDAEAAAYYDPLSPPVDVAAHGVLVGTSDQLVQIEQAGILPADFVAIVDDGGGDGDGVWKSEDGSTVVPSEYIGVSVGNDADYKVDKGDTPDVDGMLVRAAHETTIDLDSSDVPTPLCTNGKSSGGRFPLSQARHAAVMRAHHQVYNDVLKVVLVAAPGVAKSALARAIRGSQKRPRKRAMLGVDVHSWIPEQLPRKPAPVERSASREQEVDDEAMAEMKLKAMVGGTHHGADESHIDTVKFMIWDVQGASGASPDHSANFGAHPGTQSLFFSGQSLYILVSDLGWNIPETHVKAHKYRDEFDDDDDDDESESDEDNDSNDLENEWAIKKADQCLRAYYYQKVLSWVDTIHQRGPFSAILPVALLPPGIPKSEAKSRCHLLALSLMEHIQTRYGSVPSAPKLLCGGDSEILYVNAENGSGVDRLRETIIAIASDPARSVFQHVGSEVPLGTEMVLNVVRKFKEDHKLILLDHLMAEIGEVIHVDQAQICLEFLSNIGEVLYYGTADDEVLSRYIVLSRKWLVNALSCILRNDLRRELAETRRFMNMQCIYSDHKYVEDEVISTLVSGNMSNCPLLSNADAKMLWQSMSFMREASDHYSQLSETSTDTPTMFHFLERLLVHSGLFVPLGIGPRSLYALDKHEDSKVFFVPSLLVQANPRDVWTYKSKESWLTTLCHSWLFRDGVPPHLMEHLTVSILRALFEFSHDSMQHKHNPHMPPHRSDTLPGALGEPHMPPAHNRAASAPASIHEEVLGQVRIHQIMCWNLSLLVKVGTVFADPGTGEPKQSITDVFVALVDKSSEHCVASDTMGPNMQRVVVSGKGPSGHGGRKLWKGGYDLIFKAIKEALARYSNVDAQVVCPECLARSNASSACTWSWDSLYPLAQNGSSNVLCMHGHPSDPGLICGTTAEKQPAIHVEPTRNRSAKPVNEILSSVVIVGLWDKDSQKLINVGSGFVVNKKEGLIVTAGHVLFSLASGDKAFGLPYRGYPNANVVIGVIPVEGEDAVFRYFGEIVAHDIQHVDACVVRITSRLEQDVDDIGKGFANQKEEMMTRDMLNEQRLKPLKLTPKFEMEESIRVVGFNQGHIVGFSKGGNGHIAKNEKVNRTADFAKGYIVRRFEAPQNDDDSSDSDSHASFSPREELVIMCPTISGHSGGPCVSDEGKVVGILSRADPVDRQRCYLVPSSEIRELVNAAKRKL